MKESPLDILMKQLIAMWEDTLGGIFSIMHPRYDELGGEGVTFPLEWHPVLINGKRTFLAWGIQHVKQKHPDFTIKEPVLEFLDVKKGSDVNNWVITSKEDRENWTAYDKRRLSKSVLNKADIIAVRRDAVENKMTVEQLVVKYKSTEIAIERTLYFKASQPIEEITPQLNVPYGKKVL